MDSGVEVGADHGSAGIPSRRQRLVLWFLLACWLVVILPGGLLHGERLADGDLLGLHRPFKTMMIDLWQRAGGLPLWTPDLASGKPFAANPHYGALHPTTVLFLALPFELAFALWVLLPVPLAGVAMVFFLRSIGRPRHISLILGAAWGFGGYSLSLTTMPPISWTVVPLPATLAFAWRLVRSRRWFDVAGLALCLALQIVAGLPHVLMATALLLVVIVLDAWWWGPDHRTGERTLRSAAAPAGRLLAGALLGTMLAAPVLLSGLHLAKKTVRLSDKTLFDAADWSMPAQRIVEPVAPRLNGHPGQYWRADWYREPRHEPLIRSLYPGILVTVLAAAWVILGRRRAALWLLTGVLGVLLSLGEHTVVWPFLGKLLPPLTSIRYPEKWVLIPAFVTVVLAASAWQALDSGDRRVRRIVLAGLAMAVVLQLALAGSASRPGLWSADTPAAAPGLLATDCLLFAGVAAVVLGAVLLTGRRRRQWSWLVLSAVLCLDLVVAGKPLLSTWQSDEIDKPPPQLEPIVPPPVVRLFHLADWQPACRRSGGLAIAPPPRPIQWGIPLALNKDDDLTQLVWSQQTMRAVAAVATDSPELLHPMLQRRSIGAVLHCPLAGTASRSQNLVAVLDRVADPQPEAFCVERTVTAGDLSEWRKAVAGLGEAMVSTAIIDGSLSGPQARSIPVEPAPCAVTVVADSPGHLELAVTAHGPQASFLAINQTWDDDWFTTVDGETVALDRCDGDLSGLVLQAGDHTVTLHYRDLWLQRGLVIAGCGLLLLLAAVVADAVSRRRSRQNG